MRCYLRCFLLFFTLNLFADVNYTNPTTVTGSPPNTLSDGTQNADAPQIAANSTGQYVYAIWKTSNGTKTIIQIVKSSDYGVSWDTPITTLSDGTQDAGEPQITTDSTGQYVYAIWQRSNGTNTIIQTVKSEDYGNTWEDPTTVPGDGAGPNLSMSGQDANQPQITTDSTGQHVYAVWRRKKVVQYGTFYFIQTAYSADRGRNWFYPTTVTGTAPPDLSRNQLGDAEIPQIATDSTGEHVYAIWQSDISRYTQVAISSDHGVSWSNPTTVTGNQPPNLSGDLTFSPQIATSSNGQYVHAIWRKNLGAGSTVIQVVKSFDYGNSWEYPTTPTEAPPNTLSVPGKIAQYPKIITDYRGKYVYVVWGRPNDASLITVQIAKSSDYGDTWEYPTTVTGAPPNNLSQTFNASDPQISVDSTGRYINVIWKSDAATDVIQLVNGFKTDVVTSLVQLFGSQIKVRFPFEIELTNKLSWRNIAQAAHYRIYADASLTNLITEIPVSNSDYTFHRIKHGTYHTYYVTWVDSYGEESLASQITIP